MTTTRRMEKVQDLVEEAKRRTILWGIFVLGLAYLLSLTSNSMWLNIPIAVLMLASLRYVSFEVEIRRRVTEPSIPFHLAHLLKHQLSPNDPLLLSPSISTKWRRKIDSPMVEAAIDSFTCHIVREFVTDLWYASLSSDQDVPEQLKLMINDIFGEIAQRVKRINLINLLTRDLVDLVGSHLELFRQTKVSIGAKFFETLSSDEREERLRSILSRKNQLHPALFSPDSEYKVLRQLMGGVVAMLLRPQDGQCLLVRSLARELLACAVLRPVLNFVSPSVINKAIEKATTSAKVKSQTGTDSLDASLDGRSSKQGSAKPFESGNPTKNTLVSSRGSATDTERDWAQVLDVVSKRRTTTLAPENLDNLWAKGRNYRKKDRALLKPTMAGVSRTSSEISSKMPDRQVGSGIKAMSGKLGVPDISSRDSQDAKYSMMSERPNTQQEHQERHGNGAEWHNKRSRTSNEGWQKLERPLTAQDSSHNYWDSLGMRGSSGNVGFDPVADWLNDPDGLTKQSPSSHSVASKLNCWVIGAHLEKLASQTFAVYSIAVTDSDNNTWFVERRFRNFEQLHRNLRDLPQYNLQLPPKRILSSSLDDAFVRDRCILLDKYLKDLLSIPSLAELHEVWDFLSVTSKKYAFSKSASVMKTIAVNVDDAVDDMVRQLKGVSDGIFKQLGAPPSPPREGVSQPALDVSKCELPSSYNATSLEGERSMQFSDDEYDGLHGVVEEDSSCLLDGWHSDSELQMPESRTRAFGWGAPDYEKTDQQQEKKIKRLGSDTVSPEESLVGSEVIEEDPAVPPEWTPPKLTVPLLNLVDGIFQLQRRGWIRRQVFWMAKQILQLGMGDAVDDWLVTQVQWLRKEDVVASGINSLEELLWPGGLFITKSKKEANPNMPAGKVAKQSTQKVLDQSALFESQLEASRCARVVYGVLVEGGPAALVSLVGKRQYTKCAKDIYYFLQSTVFLKQLTFSVLETLITATFPELSRLVVDIRRRGPGQVVI